MERRHLFGAGVAASGVFLAIVQTVHGLQQSRRGLVFAFEAGPFILIALTLTYAGYWLSRQPEIEADVPWILAWGLGGTVLFSSVGALLLFSQRVFLDTLDRATFVAFDHITLGAVVGILIGIYDARGRRRRRKLRAERDRIEAFGNKAADVNNYGRALNQCRSVDDVSALCIEAMQTLLGVSEVGVLALDEESVEVVDDTILNVDDETLATLGRRATDDERATVVTREDVPADIANRASGVVSLELTSVTDTSFVMVALAPETAFAEEDIQLMELLASHGGTAIDGILSEESSTHSAPQNE